MKPQKQTQAQSILEFALIFPLLFFLIMGFFDLGRAMLYLSTLNTAVREGTRWAIVQPKGVSITSIQDHVRTYYFNNADLANNSTIEPVFNYAEENPTITITITYTFLPITPGLKDLLGSGSGIPLQAESTMLLTPYSK